MTLMDSQHARPPEKGPDSPTTIAQAVAAYLDVVSLARSANTTRTYRNALQVFLQTLDEHDLSPEKTPIAALPEDAVAWFATALKHHAPATERLYLSAVSGFYEYLAAENLANINLPRVRLLIRQRGRRAGIRLPQFPRENIERVLGYAKNLSENPAETTQDRLRNLRDRAFLLTLADTGLRVHEACALRRGDIDWHEGRAIIVGKGDKQAVVRFSQRALRAIQDYLQARASLDGNSGRPLRALPLFARHDKGAGKKVLPISTATGRNIVAQRVREALGPEAVGSITPHSWNAATRRAASAMWKRPPMAAAAFARGAARPPKPPLACPPCRGKPPQPPNPAPSPTPPSRCCSTIFARLLTSVRLSAPPTPQAQPTSTLPASPPPQSTPACGKPPSARKSGFPGAATPTALRWFPA